MPTERKLAAILSADVVGDCRLMAADETGTIQTLKSPRDLVRQLIDGLLKAGLKEWTSIECRRYAMKERNLTREEGRSGTSRRL